MKPILIFLFVGLVAYLIIHMCGGFSGRSKRQRPARTDVDQSLIVLDNLVSLNDRDLSQLKGEIQDLKNLLDKMPGERSPAGKKPDTPNRGVYRGRAPAHDTKSKVSGKELLQKIEREARAEVPIVKADKRSSGFLPRIIVVQIILLLIVILVMLI